ncbi:reverse transcriptase domain-containing protein [Tanacetum coccineum]
MTKQGNFTQRTPQAKKQSDQASRQVSKQASGSTNTPYDLVFPATGPSLGTTQPTATITSTEDLQRAAFTTPPQTAPGTNTTEPPPPPIRNKGPELGADNLTLEGVATELAPSDFVSQNYETLVALMQEETKKRSSQSLQARLNFGPEDEVSPPRHRKERRRKDNRRPPVFGRIGKQVSGTQTANLQNLDTHENNDRRISVRDRLGSRDVHSRLGQRRSPSESPPSSDSEDSRRKRRRRVSSSSEDTLTTNTETATENQEQIREMKTRLCPVHGVVKRKKCAKNPVELARVKQRQGESTSAYVERYKDECIHVKACPEILKISGFMNGINNPELIKRLNDRVPQTFDELMKRTRGVAGNVKYTPLTMTPKEILATEGSNFPKPPPMRTPEEQRVGNGYCEYHRQKGHTTNECVQLRQLIDKLVKEGRLDHLVKNIKDGIHAEVYTMTGSPTQLWSKERWYLAICWTSPTLPSMSTRLLSTTEIDWKMESLCETPSMLLRNIQDSGDFLIEKPETDAVHPERSKTQDPLDLITMDRHSLDGSGAASSTLTRKIEFNLRTALEFSATNTEAENEALHCGTTISSSNGCTKPRSNVDSRLVANQGWLNYVLREIHAGSCSMHSGPRSVVARALRSGYYWPTMHRDARDMIQKCNDCQSYAKNQSTLWIDIKAGGQRNCPLSCGHIAQQSKLAQGTLPSLLSMGRKPLYQPKSECQLYVPRRSMSQPMTTSELSDLDILEERRNKHHNEIEKAQVANEGYYDAKVRGSSHLDQRPPFIFLIVLTTQATWEDTRKLGPKWKDNDVRSTWKRSIQAA